MDFFYNCISKIAHLYLFFNISQFMYNNYDNYSTVNKIFNDDKINKYMVEFSIKAIEYYSTGEIYLNKLKRKIKAFIDSNPDLKIFIKNFYKNKINENIELISNGDSISSISMNDFISNYMLDKSLIELKNDDFYIYSDLNEENELINKIIIKDYEQFIKKNKLLNQNENKIIEYNETGYKFIMFEIIVDDISISVDMTTEKYNYLIIDNIFDCSFIKYFLKKYHNNIYNKLSEEQITSYKIKIIDHNINVLEFTNKPIIISKEKGIKYLNEEIKNDFNEDSDNKVNKSDNLVVDNIDEKNISNSEQKKSKYDINEEYDCIDPEVYYKYN